MKIFPYVALAVIVPLAGLMAWGYYYGKTHAALDIQVEDTAFVSGSQMYRVPKGAVLQFLDEAGAPLAMARTVEPWGYLLAQQPGLGDCTPVEGRGGTAYSDCFKGYSRWVDGWAMRTRFATLTLGACVIPRVPVAVTNYGGDAASWWFPLQHGSGLQPAWIRMHIRIDSRAACAAPARRTEDAKVVSRVPDLDTRLTLPG